MSNNYSADEINTILAAHEKILLRKKPSPTQRKVWNSHYYITHKDAVSRWNSTYYNKNKQHVRDRQKYNYYNKSNRLHVLKEKYPDIYKMYVIE